MFFNFIVFLSKQIGYICICMLLVTLYIWMALHMYDMGGHVYVCYIVQLDILIYILFV
jgi:hypothetical protein